MKRLLLLLLLIISTSQAFENQVFLRLGAQLTFSWSHTDDHLRYDNQIYGAGFSTQFGYVFTKYEFGVTTHMHVGAIDNYYLEDSGEWLKGHGRMTKEFFTLYIKRYFEAYPFKFWRLYLTIGPSVSFTTIRLREFDSSTTAFTHNHKITTDGVGLHFAIGIEEHAKKKESKPNYVQLSYSGHRPTRLRIIDASDYTQVSNIYESDSGVDVINHTIMLEVGFVLL